METNKDFSVGEIRHMTRRKPVNLDSLEDAPKPSRKRAAKPEDSGLLVSPHDAELNALKRKLKGWRGDEAKNIQESKTLISSGSWELDLCMGRYCPKFGNGGYAQRQFVEVAAETATGKSSLSENFTREAERKGQFVTFLISEEPAFHRWERLGIHPSHHLILPTYEDATDGKDKKRMAAEPRMADALEAIKSPNCAGLVVDSAKAMVGLMQLFEKGKEKQGKKEFGSRLVAPRANFFEEFFNQIKEANNVAVIMVLLT